MTISLRRRSALGRSVQLKTLRMSADVCGDLRAQFEAGDVGLSVLLEMELAALPGEGGKDGAARCGEA